MMCKIQTKLHLILLNSFFLVSLSNYSYTQIPKIDDENYSTLPALDDPVVISKDQQKKLNIIKLVIEGNNVVKTQVILNHIPYKVGQLFDASKSPIAISNLYSLGYFRQIKIESEEANENDVILYVTVEEKKLLEKFDFKGNKTIKTKKIKEKLNLGKMTTIDEEAMDKIAKEIKKLYKEENRHMVKITPKLTVNKDHTKKAIASFDINEGPSSKVVRVLFKGNKHFPSRKLQKAIYTRENWLFGFMDNSGSYNDEALEIDKHRLEYFYRDNGYLMTKVTKADVKFSHKEKDIIATFHIEEGPQFIVRELAAPGDEIFTERELMPLIKLERGKPYSQSKLVQSINKLKDLWGEKGYIYADVYPQVKPDEKTNEVDITFHVERGKLMHVNRIIITGNKITRDKLIRRQLELVEGELITTPKLNRSKSGVEYLSFFDHEGVDWKVHRISDDLADLEMHVKEKKTGMLQFQMSYGSDQYSSQPSLKGGVTVEKSNLFGLGWDAGGLIQANRHHLQRLEAHFFDPYFLDQDNLSAGFNVYKRWDEFEFWHSVDKTPVQRVMGGDVRLGFSIPKIDKKLTAFIDLGIEDIRNNHPRATNEVFRPIVQRTFQTGDLKWIGLDFVKDTRNHQIYPNSGYKLLLSTKTAPPGINNEFSLFKTELSASWFTALIGYDSLVLGLRCKGGFVHAIKYDKVVPYKELFQMGGQETVRGFVWGSIGPAWATGDPLGGRKFLQMNAELIFPLVNDYSIKGHVFYDNGAGWDTPKKDLDGITSYLRRDKFHLRHSIGLGLNLMNPMPAKIDWGFKLDRKKKDGESPHEFHLTMNYAW